MKRRLAAVLLVAGCATLALGGCDQEPGAPGNGAQTTLSYAFWDKNQQSAMEQIAAEFTANHPEIQIKTQLIPYSDYFTKLDVMLPNGEAPDVFWLNAATLQHYASSGQLSPLPEVDTSTYPDTLVELFSHEGTLYGAPKDLDTIAMWYNKELFDSAGVAYPKPGWTWEDMTSTAAALTDPAAGVWGIVTAPYGQVYHYNTIPQAGGEVISTDGTTSGFDSPEALSGVTVWTNLIEQGWAPSMAQVAENSPDSLFQSGKVAMLPNGSWAAGIYANNPDLVGAIEVAPLPAGPTGNQSVIHGLGNVVAASSKHQDAAAQFAAFASGKRAAQIQASLGAAIPAYEGTQQAWVENAPEFNLQVYIDAIETAAPYPMSQNTFGWTSIEIEVLTQVWAGNVSPEKGLADLSKKMQAALDSEDP